jgi:hypothetical protein
MSTLPSAQATRKSPRFNEIPEFVGICETSGIVFGNIANVEDMVYRRSGS